MNGERQLYFKQNKYGNKKTVVDGIKFDSKLEAEYYQLLKFKKAQGHIQDFKLQPRYTLQETFKRDGKTYRSITYVADFEIMQNDGSVVVVDCKGVMTDVFKIKAKIFTKLYGKLYLVKRNKAGFKLEEF